MQLSGGENDRFRFSDVGNYLGGWGDRDSVMD